MKHLHMFVAAGFLCCTSLSGQTIVITFTGTVNGSPASLDSIQVMNLSAGGDTTITWPDNVLVLSAVGIEETTSSTGPLVSMPNPFHGSAEILVDAYGQGEILLVINDASGREMAARREVVAPGQHRFRFSSIEAGIHILSVWQNGRYCTQRMVAMGGVGAEGNSLSYLGMVRGRMSKSDRSLFTWQPGEELRYTGYTTSNGSVLSATIEEFPSVSVTRTFAFVGMECPGTPDVTDIDGNTYPVVQIGSQCWMAANLRTGRYRDGSFIPPVSDSATWTQLSTAAWCNYQNSPGNGNTYGKLYNWYAAANPNICPLGWHVPSDVEWMTLETALGMPTGELNAVGNRGMAENVGGKLKSTGTVEAGTGLWHQPNSGATNETGFSALPGGLRGFYSFQGLNAQAQWWTVSETGSLDFVWNRGLYYSNAGMHRGDSFKQTGFCVRCIRD